jgi:SAM-dependent methyltransferase
MPEYNFILKKNGLVNVKRHNKSIKLSIGPGGGEYPGYLSVDLHDQRAFIVMDVTQLDFAENSVSEILAINIFEYLNPYHVADILKRWKKVLKPGGKLVMEMPDIEALFKRFATANTEERYGILNTMYQTVDAVRPSGQDRITYPKLFGWWHQSLWDHLSNAGLVSIQFGSKKPQNPESNLHVEATKP